MEIRCNRSVDGKNSIQSAVNALPEEGGRVTVPPGRWESGPIQLRSHVELHLEDGALIHFSEDPKSYASPVFTRLHGIEGVGMQPLILAQDASDVVISGNGMLDGGDLWKDYEKVQERAFESLKAASEKEIPARERILLEKDCAILPGFIQFVGCRQVYLREFAIRGGPALSIHPIWCQDVTAKDLTVRTGCSWGCSFCADSCEDVRVEDCLFDTVADGLCISAGAEQNLQPCRNITVRRCYFTGCNNGIHIGSAVSGGIYGITVSDCVIENGGSGIAIDTEEGKEGVVKGAEFSRIRMNGMNDTAIRARGSRKAELSDFSFRSIYGRGCSKGIQVIGEKSNPIRRITMTGMHIQSGMPDTIRFAEPKAGILQLA